MATNAVEPNRPETGPIVDISIDNKPFRVHRGSVTVAELKALAGIPAGYELEEVKDKQLIPLDDGGRVTLKGGEKFISHPRDGASS